MNLALVLACSWLPKVYQVVSQFVELCGLYIVNAYINECFWYAFQVVPFNSCFDTIRGSTGQQSHFCIRDEFMEVNVFSIRVHIEDYMLPCWFNTVLIILWNCVKKTLRNSRRAARAEEMKSKGRGGIMDPARSAGLPEKNWNLGG